MKDPVTASRKLMLLPEYVWKDEGTELVPNSVLAAVDFRIHSLLRDIEQFKVDKFMTTDFGKVSLEANLIVKLAEPRVLSYGAKGKPIFTWYKITAKGERYRVPKTWSSQLKRSGADEVVPHCEVATMDCPIFRNTYPPTYPLMQITVKLQGTRHSDRDAIIEQLDIVRKRLLAGDRQGYDHDDDFGYAFEFVEVSTGPSFFDESCG
jgi:hypothetical protein